MISIKMNKSIIQQDFNGFWLGNGSKLVCLAFLQPHVYEIPGNLMYLVRILPEIDCSSTKRHIF